MELPVDEWFQLPFLGTEIFVALMRARLQYDRASRRFMITNRTNVEQVLAVLSNALKEPVKIRVELKNPTCFVCSGDVQCEQCRYNEICPKTPPYCLCSKHSGALASFEEYSSKFIEAAQIPILSADTAAQQAADGIWTEKYRPTHLTQMVGNERSRIEFLRWLQKWKPRSKPAVLLGPPGTGKTALVNVASRDLGYELIQLNASDERSRSKLEKSLLPGIVNQPLVADWSSNKRVIRRLIFLDEIDGLYGRADFGAAPFLKELLPLSSYPVVMAANNEDSEVVQQIGGSDSNSVNTIHFSRALPRQVELYLREILRQEGISVDKEVLEFMIERANGDLRAAINNLEMVGRNPDSVRILNYRDEQISRRESFKRLLSAQSQRDMYEALELLPIGDLRELMQLAAANLLTNPINPRKRAHAFELLSRLDLLVRRIQASQNWTLLRYVRRILAGVLFIAKNDQWRIVEDDPDFQKLRFRVWNDRRIIAECGRKIADASHVSLRTALADFYPYLLITYGGEGEKRELAELLAFDESSERVTDREIQQIENLLEAIPRSHTVKK